MFLRLENLFSSSESGTTLIMLEKECPIAGRSIFLFLEGLVTISLLFFFHVVRSQILPIIDKQYYLRIEKGSSDGINTLTRSLCYALLPRSIDSL